MGQNYRRLPESPRSYLFVDHLILHSNTAIPLSRHSASRNSLICCRGLKTSSKGFDTSPLLESRSRHRSKTPPDKYESYFSSLLYLSFCVID